MHPNSVAPHSLHTPHSKDACSNDSHPLSFLSAALPYAKFVFTLGPVPVALQRASSVLLADVSLSKKARLSSQRLILQISGHTRKVGQSVMRLAISCFPRYKIDDNKRAGGHRYSAPETASISVKCTRLSTLSSLVLEEIKGPLCWQTWIQPRAMTSLQP